MWVVAGVLLGLVLLASVVGFHVGPHGHVVAGVIGVVAAAWLVAMWVSGDGRPLLYLLLGADLAVSGAVAASAWRGLVALHARPAAGAPGRLAGTEGVALNELAPDGLVRVKGETWSATSLNGTIAAGSPVQVIQAGGVRLGVWGEPALPGAPEVTPIAGAAEDEEGSTPS